MRLCFLLIAAVLSGSAARAQQAQPSSTGGTEATVQRDSTPGEVPSLDLPVSIDHIREGLAKPAPLLLRADRTPDFKTQVEEEQRLSEIIASLDFGSGPPPPGGLYHYEQQRMLFSPMSRPLMQPYAAFTGGQLITLAIESLIGKYLGGQAVEAITEHDRARAETAARVEVARAIADYCAAQPKGGAGILICDNPSVAAR